MRKIEQRQLHTINWLRLAIESLSAQSWITLITCFLHIFPQGGKFSILRVFARSTGETDKHSILLLLLLLHSQVGLALASSQAAVGLQKKRLLTSTSSIERMKMREEKAEKGANLGGWGRKEEKINLCYTYTIRNYTTYKSICLFAVGKNISEWVGVGGGKRSFWKGKSGAL